MTNYCFRKWKSNRKVLEEQLKTINIQNVNYKNLVKIAVECVLNEISEGNNSDPTLDVDSITEIDNGEYHGTLIYLIPKDTYQPSPEDYIMTYIYYGSCCGCDLLQHIQVIDNSRALDDLMILCKDIIKPYNFGFSHDDEFNQVEI